jgi:hypothetical protein
MRKFMMFLLAALIIVSIKTTVRADILPNYEFHDLNDNQVPTGWTQQILWGSGGIQNGRLYARVTDAQANLTRMGTLAAGASGIRIQYDGNVYYSSNGMVNGVGLLAGADTFAVTDGIRFGVQENRPMIWKNSPNVPGGLIYSQTFPIAYTDYHYIVEFTEGQIKYKAIRISDGTTLFDISVNDSRLHLAQVQGVTLSAYATTENDCWVDNISLEVLGGQQPIGLVAYWSLDEQSGTLVADSSGNSLNGTASGATIIDGVKGKARSFNGTNNYIEVTNNSLLNINTQITLMMWAKIDPTSTEGFLISKRVQSDVNCDINYDIKYGRYPSGLYLILQYGTGCATGSNYALFNLTDFDDNQWHHLAVSFVFGQPSSALWMIDGAVRAGTWTHWDGSPGGGDQIPNANSYALEIGRQLSTSPGYFKGGIDQIRIFDRALSQGEILDIYNAEKPQPGLTPTVLTMTVSDPPYHTGDYVQFKCKLTDSSGNPLAGKTINFSWSYTGLDPAGNFSGSDNRTTDLLGECSMQWFSKWAAFTGNVTATIQAQFTGDLDYQQNQVLQFLPIQFVPAELHVRVFRDANCNGKWDPGIDALLPNVALSVSSAYNNYKVESTLQTGETILYIPKCAYEIDAVVNSATVQSNLNTTDFDADNRAYVNLPWMPNESILKIRNISINGQDEPFSVISNQEVTVSVVIENIGGKPSPSLPIRVGVFGLDFCSEGPPVNFCWIAYLQGATDRAQVRTQRILDLQLPSIGACGTYEFEIPKAYFNSPGWTDNVYVEIVPVDISAKMADRTIMDCGWFNAPLCSPERKVLPKDWLDYMRPIVVQQNLWTGVECGLNLLSLVTFGASAVVEAGIVCMADATDAGQKLVWMRHEIEEGRLSDAFLSFGQFWGDVFDCAFARGKVTAPELVNTVAAKILSYLLAVVEELRTHSCSNYIFESLTTVSKSAWDLVVGLLQRASQLPNVKLPILINVGCTVDLSVLHEGDTLLVINHEGVTDSRNQSASGVQILDQKYAVLDAQWAYDIRVVAKDTGWCTIKYCGPNGDSSFAVASFPPIYLPKGAMVTWSTRDASSLSLDLNGDGTVEGALSPYWNGDLAQWPPTYSCCVGRVRTTLGQPLIGVRLDIFDSDGNPWESVATDSSGYYRIDSIPNGNYSIAVVTPLGYQADQETREFTINHAPVTIDFSLTKLSITPRPRSRAYWADQLTRALQNKPQDYTLKDFSRFTGLISVHFNQNQINPVDFYSVPQPASQSDSLMVLKKILLMCTSDKDPFLKRLGKSDVIALMLNVVSGKISQTQAISADGRTVSQAITYCDMLVNDEIDCPNTIPGHGVQGCRYILADLILTLVNFGLKVPKDLIPADVIQIAYKIHGEETLPIGFILEQNYPNPFNPKTQIDYALPKDCNVKVVIYNILGQKVMTLVDEFQTAGFRIVVWDGKDDKGQDCASGIYFYKIQAGEFSQAKKMVIVK